MSRKTRSGTRAGLGLDSPAEGESSLVMSPYGDPGELPGEPA
jgi:hypothetical protein